MKTFNKIREDSLLEVLKASDPAGKWIHDFVHSDNPKFAGKSKKERIRMALGASYAAKRNEEVEPVDEGAFSSGALKPSKAALDAIAKIPSKGTVRGKDAKGVYTAKTVNGKEVSRVYENKLADRESDFDFHPTIKNKKVPDQDEMVPVHVVKPQITFSSLRNKKDKEKEEKNMDEAYPSYSGDRSEKLVKHSINLYTQSKSENDPNKKSDLIAKSNKAHKVAMLAQKQHHKRNPAEVQAYISHAMKPPKGWTND